MFLVEKDVTCFCWLISFAVESPSKRTNNKQAKNDCKRTRDKHANKQATAEVVLEAVPVLRYSHLRGTLIYAHGSGGCSWDNFRICRSQTSLCNFDPCALLILGFLDFPFQPGKQQLTFWPVCLFGRPSLFPRVPGLYTFGREITEKAITFNLYLLYLPGP